jgi:hypothetical protein
MRDMAGTLPSGSSRLHVCLGHPESPTPGTSVHSSIAGGAVVALVAP